MPAKRWLLPLTVILVLDFGLSGVAAPLRVAPFKVEITPPLGSPLAYNPAVRVDDSLQACGLVLLSGQQPIVLCAVDWIGIANAGQDAWKSALAKAAGTVPERVEVHTLHQHDAPRCDLSMEALLRDVGLGGRTVDLDYVTNTLEKVASAIALSLQHPREVTHLGLGKARVEHVASNRRLLGPDGKVRAMRFSSVPRNAANYDKVEAPEGLIDPWLRLVSFWEGDTPIASITYYATHPQSYYRTGGISADFPGLARGMRQRELPEAVHIHFNGAGGNVAAGKYNDGTPAARYFLSCRLAEGMRQAWDAQVKVPVSADDLQWRIENVQLPINDRGSESELRAKLADPKVQPADRESAARELAYIARHASGRGIDITCLQLGAVSILHLPGELFVEYQLAAQATRPDQFVCLAAYGEYGPGYIGTTEAYSQGGYETSRAASRTTPEAERILLEAIRQLLSR